MDSNVTRPLAIDGFRPSAGRPAGSTPTAQPPVKRLYFRPQPAKPQRRWLKKLELPLLLVTATLGGFFADNLAFGLGLLAVYGTAALIAHVPSRTTFTLALLLLAAISILLLLRPNPQLIGNFATYAFVLVLVGAVTLGKEARMPKRLPRKYKR